MDLVSCYFSGIDFSMCLLFYHRTLQGDKGDRWLNGQVTIRSSAYFRLQIEGVIGKSSHLSPSGLIYVYRFVVHLGTSFQGDAAIDDLRIFENPCVLTPSDADPTLLPPSTTTTLAPTTPISLGPYDCTFETDICNGWDNMANNRFNWTRVQALSTPAPRIYIYLFEYYFDSYMNIFCFHFSNRSHNAH